MTQEIKDEVEKRRRSDEGVGTLTLSVAAPYVTRVAAELTYDFKDRYIPHLCCDHQQLQSIHFNHVICRLQAHILKFALKGHMHYWSAVTATSSCYSKSGVHITCAATPRQSVWQCMVGVKALPLMFCRTVHNDVYKIIKYSIQKSMSGEVAQRALDWWAGLVEHLFGLPVRTPEQEKAVVPASEDHSNRVKVRFTNVFRSLLSL